MSMRRYWVGGRVREIYHEYGVPMEMQKHQYHEGKRTTMRRIRGKGILSAIKTGYEIAKVVLPAVLDAVKAGTAAYDAYKGHQESSKPAEVVKQVTVKEETKPKSTTTKKKKKAKKAKKGKGLPRSHDEDIIASIRRNFH